MDFLMEKLCPVSDRNESFACDVFEIYVSKFSCGISARVRNVLQTASVNLLKYSNSDVELIGPC